MARKPEERVDSAAENQADAKKPTGEQPTPAAEQERSSASMGLLVLVVPDADALDDLVTTMLDKGVPGTIIEGKGLMSFVREEMPIFSGLAAMMPKATGSHVVLSVTTREKAQGFVSYLDEEREGGTKLVAAVVPIDRFLLPSA